jgi:hypothetical protein
MPTMHFGKAHYVPNPGIHEQAAGDSTASDTAVPAAEPQGGDSVVVFLAVVCACIALAAVYRVSSRNRFRRNGWKRSSEPAVPSGLLRLATPIFYDSIQLTFQRQWENSSFERQEEFRCTATFEEISSSFGALPPLLHSLPIVHCF